MNIGHNLGLLAADELRGFVIRENLSPTFLEAHDVRSLALRHLGETIGEISICEHGELGSGLHEVGHGSFHARAARTGNHQRGAVSGSEGGLEQLLDISHHLNEVRVEVPHDRLRQRLIDAWVNHAGSGTEQIAARRLQGGK